jgi:hypothetical protein
MDSLIDTTYQQEDMGSNESFLAFNQILALGRKKGFVTPEDLIQFFPEAEEDVNQLDKYLLR